MKYNEAAELLSEFHTDKPYLEMIFTDKHEEALNLAITFLNKFSYVTESTFYKLVDECYTIKPDDPRYDDCNKYDVCEDCPYGKLSSVIERKLSNHEIATYLINNILPPYIYDNRQEAEQILAKERNEYGTINKSL